MATKLLYILLQPSFHEWTKHLDIDCHIVGEKFKQELFIHVISLLNFILQTFSQNLYPPLSLPISRPSWVILIFIKLQLKKRGEGGCTNYFNFSYFSFISFYLIFLYFLQFFIHSLKIPSSHFILKIREYCYSFSSFPS